MSERTEKIAQELCESWGEDDFPENPVDDIEKALDDERERTIRECLEEFKHEWSDTINIGPIYQRIIDRFVSLLEKP